MTINLEINSKDIKAEPGQSVFDCAELVGVQVPTSCRKNGKCRECMVEVTEGSELLSPLAEEESHLRDGFRLSCRAYVTEQSGNIKCHTLRRGEMRIESSSSGLTDIPLPEGLTPAVTRDGEWVLLDGNQLVRAAGQLLGLAIDLGTTTIVVRLHDLETGEILAVQSFENPQRFAGTDVMSRIQYDTEQGKKLLQRTLLAYLGHLIDDLPCDSQQIYEVVVAGNTTMRDLFFGLDVTTVGQRPYRSITEHELKSNQRSTTAIDTSAKKLRLPIFPEARIVGLPLISGHVGADAAACLLAIGILYEDRTVALMDIGTNTELIVGNRHRLMAASCPAGPAFEGGAIQCGMPGLEGAIESVQLSQAGIESMGVIGEAQPQGICGSGLIDLLGELRRTERINELGRFVDESEQFSLTSTEGLVYLHEQDISELAQAKGANVAGLRILLKAYGIDLDGIDQFYLAGGFARQINLDSARRIGLIPDVSDERLVQIGNASMEGASRALCSMLERDALEKLVGQIGHVELETDEQFFDYFVEGCQFVPVTNLTCQQ